MKELLKLEKEINQRIQQKEAKLLQSGYTQEDIDLIKEALEYIAYPLLDEYYPHEQNMRVLNDES